MTAPIPCFVIHDIRVTIGTGPQRWQDHQQRTPVSWVSLKRSKNRDMAIGRAINRQGSIVVDHASGFCGQPQAEVWQDTTPQRVPGTEHGNLGSTASAVNDRGDIAGHRCPRGGHGERAYVVRDGVLTDLTGPDLVSVATGLDNRGRVVGRVLDDPRGAFLFQDGQTMFLNDLVEPAQQGQWQIMSANAINHAGELAAPRPLDHHRHRAGAETGAVNRALSGQAPGVTIKPGGGSAAPKPP